MRYILVLLFLLVPLIAFGQDIEVLKRKANQGNAEAQAKLGFAYAVGTGVPENPEKTVYLCKKAANQGNAVGQYGLGMAYLFGNGVTQNKSKAKYWVKKSHKNGHPLAKVALKNWEDWSKKAPQR